MAGQATTHQKQDQMEARLTKMEEKMDANTKAGRRGKRLDGAELVEMYSIYVPFDKDVDRNGLD